MNQTIPNNIEAEKSLLGSLFWSFDSLQKACEEVEPEMFYLDAHSKIFEVIKHLYEKKEPVDINTLVAELDSRKILNNIGGVVYLNEITSSVATGANVGYYINLVIEKYTLRRMIEVATNIIKNANNSDIDIYSFVEETEKNVLNVSKSRRTSEFRRVQDVLVKTQEDLEFLSKNKGKVTGLTTGLIDLDNLTEGLKPTQLVIVAARPVVGKTAFALNIGCAAAKSTKKNIAIFSLEMPAEQLVMRMISSLGQIDNKKLQTGRMENDDWRRVNEAISQLSETNIYFHDAGGITASEIKAKCRRLSTQGEGLGLVIIDYLQLIDSSARYSGSRQQEVSEISRSLKTMA
ncbi:MAG: replicative DNA helicase, partial [Romboutsia sp.]|nr:replicative DNA helicase [Romboutsia sp.]